MLRFTSIYSTTCKCTKESGPINAFWVVAKIPEAMVFESSTRIMESVIEQIQNRQATIEDPSQHTLRYFRVSVPILVTEVPYWETEQQYMAAEKMASRFLKGVRTGEYKLDLGRIFPAFVLARAGL